MLGFRNAVCFLDFDSSLYTSLLSWPDFNCCVDAKVSVADTRMDGQNPKDLSGTVGDQW